MNLPIPRVESLTLAEHAEAWWVERGRPMPNDKDSLEWLRMYEQWVCWAFEGISP